MPPPADPTVLQKLDALQSSVNALTNLVTAQAAELKRVQEILSDVQLAVLQVQKAQ